MEGIAASPGIAVAKAHKVDEVKIVIDKSKIPLEQVQKEIEALENAILKSRSQLNKIYETTVKTIGEEEAGIIQAHAAFLEDPMFISEMKSKIVKQHYNSVWAVNCTTEEQAALFEDIEDQYLRERAADLKDVCDRVIKNILNIPIENISDLSENVIIVGKDITPSMLAAADRLHVMGIISESGGVTSHTAILARNMEIPAVLGLKDIVGRVETGQVISLDGNTGSVELDIDVGKEVYLKKKVSEQNLIKDKLRELRDSKSTLLDGRKVELNANIGKPEDIANAVSNGAEGIGLFRTEFLFMDRNHMPDEEEQFIAYRQAVEGMKGKVVTIRTLDAGGDKEIEYLGLPKESNPFLGYRAIRICLEHKDIFRTQLRAILRASAFGKARIMYPMISSVDEVIAANKILDEVKAELRSEDVGFDEDIEVGIMVEVPSAAITADIIIRHVDFFSIGTNDLIQYTLAADRTNEKVNKIYSGFNPAVLRLIQDVIDVSHREGKHTGMCGELAGNPIATILLLGMGLDEFSMSVSSILKVRKIVTSVDTKFARLVRDGVFMLSNSTSIERYLNIILKDAGLDYLVSI